VADDASLLRTFLKHLDTLMEFAHEHRRESIPIHLRGPLEIAWPEFRNRMTHLQSQFTELNADRLNA